MSKLIKKLTPEIQSFLAEVQRGVDAWVSAGKILVALIDKDENIFETIIAHSDLKYEHLLTFERIGRGELYPRLLLDESHAAKRVIDLGLPYEKQVEICEKPFAVATVRDGKVVTVQKRLNELTRAEAALALTFTGVRPVKEQVEMVQEKKERSASGERYRIEDGGVRWFAWNELFTWAQLEEILAKRPKLNALNLQSTMQGNQLRA